MQRQVPSGWLILLWIPVVALVLGLVMGCASTGVSGAIVPPSQADLRRLVAQELEDDSRFDSFGASENPDAHRMAALFSPVVGDVVAVECRSALADSVDCTLEVVLQFPAMGGRESRTYWDRRLRQVQGGWFVVGRAFP